MLFTCIQCACAIQYVSASDSKKNKRNEEKKRNQKIVKNAGIFLLIFRHARHTFGWIFSLCILCESESFIQLLIIYSSPNACVNKKREKKWSASQCSLLSWNWSWNGEVSYKALKWSRTKKNCYSSNSSFIHKHM